MRDRDQHRYLRKQRQEREQVISKEELEERIDELNEQTEKNAALRRDEDLDRQDRLDRDGPR